MDACGASAACCAAAVASLKGCLVPSKAQRPSAGLLHYLDVLVERGKVCMLMELAPHGSLAHILDRCSAAKQRLHDDDVWSFLVQMTRALQVSARA